MSKLTLAGDIDHKTIIELLALRNLLEGNWESLQIEIEENAFFSVSAITFLASWGLKQIAGGRKFSFSGDRGKQNYLSRFDLYQVLGFNEYTERFRRHSSIGRFISLKLIDDDHSVFEVCNAICDLVLHQFDNAAQFLPAMEWCTNEIIDNVRIHSNAPTPGVVCAQYYPRLNQLKIAIVDMGIGIKASLSESYDCPSDSEAIATALRRGTTRNKDIGQGNGLAGSQEILRLNRGSFTIWSGQALYRLHNGEQIGEFSEIPKVTGTGVSLRLDTKHTVNLGDTFIGDSDWSYINAECERIYEAGGLRIEDECIHTRGRSTAQPLRRKIEALIAESEEPIKVDFSNVSQASSSFLDELLGKLAFSLDEKQFHQKLRIVNASDHIMNMANVVIHQRLSRE